MPENCVPEDKFRVRRIKSASRCDTQNGWFSRCGTCIRQPHRASGLAPQPSDQRMIRYRFHTFPALPRGPCGTRNLAVNVAKNPATYTVYRQSPGKTVNGYVDNYIYDQDADVAVIQSGASFYPAVSWQHRAGYMVLCFIATLITGCYVDPPFVTRDGEIRGGHPRVHALLVLIKERRAEAIRHHAETVSGTFYSASIQPTQQAVLLVGTIPSMDNEITANYEILCSPDTINNAYIASLTEVILFRQGKLDITTVVLEWEGDKWIVKPKWSWRKED